MASKNNSGNLFKNTFKEEGSKQPDFKGDVVVEGKVMKASMWVNKDKNGNRYFGISFQTLDEVAKYTKEVTNSTPKPEFEKTDDIPF